MNLLITILVACLTGGISFAAIAAWLTAQKGNTIKEILESGRDVESLHVEIKDQLKLTANLPIVALYVIAFAVATVIPTFAYWLILKDVTVVTLSGKIKKEADMNLNAVQEADIESASGWFHIQVPLTKEPQIFNVSGGDRYFPITLAITPYKAKSSILVELSSSGTAQNVEVPFDLTDLKAKLAEPIVLQPSQLIASPVSNLPSAAQPISATFQNVGAPPK
jgi:hypothetical protein